MSKLQFVSFCFSKYKQKLLHEDWTLTRSGMLCRFFHHIPFHRDDTVAEHFLNISFLGLLASVTDGSLPCVVG